MANTLGILNPLRYRGYVYDTETSLYYLQSRYYNADLGRFLNADDVNCLGADGALLSYNLLGYCRNNSVIHSDPSGYFCLTAAIIVAGAIVGGLLGTFTALTTGGNVVEGAVKGVLTGIIGAACGMLISSVGLAIAVATIGGCLVDVSVQATTQHIKNKQVDFLEMDCGSIIKTGLQTGLGAAIPQFGIPKTNVVDALGTTLIWAEGAAMIAFADTLITNTVFQKKSQKNYSKVPQKPTSNQTTAKSTSTQYKTVFQNGKKYIM